jgi:hypothetical protein
MASAAQKAIPDCTITKPDWWPDWSGQACAIIASGPSAKSAPIELLHGKARAIAVNESWQLCKWADVLYGCDYAWWRMQQGVPKFGGMKISQDREACDRYKDIRQITVDKRSNELLLTIGHVGAGGNSGFQALNLAVQFGASPILLIGCDMRVDLGEHWHPRHYPPLSNPHPNDNLPRWRAAFDGAAGVLKGLGVTVINCSSVSLLKAYPKMTVQEALQWPCCTPDDH